MYVVNAYPQGTATMGSSTHKNSEVIPSAGDPASFLVDHNGYATSPSHSNL